jgi:hypothetical protein
MLSMASAAHGGAPMPDMDPGMIKAAMAMVKDMPPEELARMQQMAAATMGAGGGPAAAAAGTGSAAVAGGSSSASIASAGAGAAAAAGGPPPDMLAAIAANPSMVEASMRMLKGMDEDAAVRMMLASGGMGAAGAAAGGADAEAAIRRMVRAVKGMSDGQVAAVARAASVGSGLLAKARAARDYLRERPLLVAAIVVLLLAVVLRWLGLA